MNKILCEECGEIFPGYYIINVCWDKTGDYEQICYNCSNEKVADIFGITLVDLRKNSFTMKDIDGKEHFFVVIRRVYPQGIILEAIEIKNDEPKGYSIAVDDNIDCNQYDLEIKLYQKVKNELSHKYIESKNAFGDEYLSIKEDKVIGRIGYDENNEDRAPLVVIDGQEYSWEQFGRLLMSYEGWQFKLEIFDFTEDVK